jgi:hypothetical protein
MDQVASDGKHSSLLANEIEMVMRDNEAASTLYNKNSIRSPMSSQAAT